MQLHESGEMYLETILVLSKSNPVVRSIDISEEMGFSKPSVSRAVGLLKENGYIEVDPSGYITLTDSGRDFRESRRRSFLICERNILQQNLGIGMHEHGTSVKTSISKP